jgi:hypothetical protein
MDLCRLKIDNFLAIFDPPWAEEKGNWDTPQALSLYQSKEFWMKLMNQFNSEQNVCSI